MPLELNYNSNSNVISVYTTNAREHETRALLEICIRKGMKIGFTFIIMKMMFTYPTMVNALSNYNSLPLLRNPGVGIEIPVKDQKEGQKLYQELQGVVNEANNGKPTNQGVYFNIFNEGLTFLATTALTSFAIGVGWHYLNKAIREHQPNPVYVYGAFMAAIGAIYACGSVPIIMPNIATLAAAYACSRYLAPRIGAMDDGYLKSAASILSTSLPIVASGIAAIPLYSSATKAAIATCGILIGSQIAHQVTSWKDRAITETNTSSKILSK